MAKTRIKLTKVDENVIGWRGGHLDRYMNETLALRSARKVGDEEVVNNYQLGQLNKAKAYGGIDFVRV